MIITGIDSQTGKQVQFESENVDSEFIRSMSAFDMTDENVKRIIDGLSVSADIKSLLYKITTVTIRVGETLLKVGRKIIDLICKVFSEFPNATFGMIFGAILGILVASTPFIGALLGAIVAPIAIAFGLVVGVAQDLGNMALERRIREVNAEFSPLRG